MNSGCRRGRFANTATATNSRVLLALVNCRRKMRRVDLLYPEAAYRASARRAEALKMGCRGGSATKILDVATVPLAERALTDSSRNVAGRR